MNANGAIGNYVGISTKDKNLSFAYNFVGQNSLYEINASGGVQDGVSTLITDNKLNTGVSLGFKFHRFLGTGKIAINAHEIMAIRKEDQKLTDEFKLAIVHKRGKNISN